jgi:hypothetical protein
MVALTVGGIAITSIYAIGAASTRVFYQQHQVANAQTALRMALNQIKRDMARAGYLGTPNANPAVGPVQTCAPVGPPIDDPAVSGRLAAFSAFQNDVTITANVNDAIDPTGNNDARFSADDIVLFGNFETSSDYSNVTMITGQQIEVDHDWHAFRRDFLNWHDNAVAATYSFNAAAFAEAFTTGRLIRIQTTQGLRHFARVTGITAPDAVSDVRLNFDTAIPGACNGAVDGGWVAPVSAMRYTVRNATGVEAERFPNTHGLVGQLIREEVLPTTKNQPLLDGNGNPVNRRAILDYVVTFNLAFTMNGATAPGNPDAYVPGTTTNVAATVNLNPERIRAVAIELAVRTPEQDPSFIWTAAGCANLACFQVFPAPPVVGGRPGFARVRRARAEVFAPNVAYEGY